MQNSTTTAANETDAAVADWRARFEAAKERRSFSGSLARFHASRK